jgi:hypothetical protein
LKSGKGWCHCWLVHPDLDQPKRLLLDILARPASGDVEQYVGLKMFTG